MSAPLRCISSHAMSRLFEWRNPDGHEKPNLGKVAITEIGLFVLATASVIEAVAYTVFAILSLVLSPILRFLIDEPCKFSVKLLQSSSFTILWEVAALILNLFRVEMFTHESFVRCILVEDYLPVNLLQLLSPIVLRSGDKKYLGPPNQLGQYLNQWTFC